MRERYSALQEGMVRKPRKKDLGREARGGCRG